MVGVGEGPQGAVACCCGRGPGSSRPFSLWARLAGCPPSFSAATEPGAKLMAASPSPRGLSVGLLPVSLCLCLCLYFFLPCIRDQHLLPTSLFFPLSFRVITR